MSRGSLEAGLRAVLVAGAGLSLVLGAGQAAVLAWAVAGHRAAHSSRAIVTKPPRLAKQSGCSTVLYCIIILLYCTVQCNVCTGVVSECPVHGDRKISTVSAVSRQRTLGVKTTFQISFFS